MKLRMPPVPGAMFSAGLLLAMASLSPLSAAIIARDSFNYAEHSALSGLNGGSGFASGWTNQITNTPAAITSNTFEHQVPGGGVINGGGTGLSITANGALPPASFVQTPAAIQRALAQSVSVDTVYVSFLFNQTGSGASNLDRFALWLGNGTDANGPYAGMLQTSGSGFFARTDSNTSTTASGGARVAAGNTYQIVLEVSKSTPGAANLYDQVRLWVNPGVNASLTPLLFANTVGSNALASFSTIGLELRNQNPAQKTYYFDELVIGTTWRDVVPDVAPIPEPSTWAALALGASVLLLRRRRRVTLEDKRS